MSPILLDSIVGIVILLSAVFSFFRGFVKEALTIVNVLGAAAGAWLGGPIMRPHFNKWLDVGVVEKGVQPKPEDIEKIWGVVPPEIMAAFLSYASVFFGLFLILTLAGLYISGSVKAMGLGPLDKTLGVAFGGARGFLLVFLAYLPFAYFMVPDQYPKWAQDSVSVAVLQKTYEYGDEYMKAEKEKIAEEKKDPNSIANKLDNLADKVDAPAEEYQDSQDILTDKERNAAP